MHKNKLGRTDLFVSHVGMGVLTIGKTQLNLSIKEGADVIKHAVVSGINFFDTAQYYETYDYMRATFDELKSKYGKDVLEELVISSKSLTANYDSMCFAIDECLKALDMKQLDIFLMHEVRGELDYNGRTGARRALIDAKNKGKVRYIGISSHHVDAIALAAQDEEMDVVFPLINKNSLGIRTIDKNGKDRFADKSEMEEAIAIANKNNKGIFLMKVLGGGNLAKDYINMMDYANSIDGVASLMLGMGSKTDIDIAISYVNGTLDRNYAPDMSSKKIRIDQGDCEGCGACILRCPNKAIYMQSSGTADIDHSICLTCGYCAPVCTVRAIIMY